MKESTLLKLSIVFSLLGTIVLFYISSSISIEETTVNKITSGSSGEYVLVKGAIASISDKESIMIIDIEKNEKIPVVLFKNDLNNMIELKKGDFVEVRGKTEEYKGRIEIIADEIRFLR